MSKPTASKSARGKSHIISAVIALADCTAHERNYNRHPDSQVADIAESLQTFGQVKPIVVHAQANGKYAIIAGQGVALGARKLGWERIEARVLPAQWSKTKALAYLAADNELARRGDPDQAQLAQIVKDIADAEGEALAKLAAGDANALRDLLRVASPVEETADAGELLDKAAELQKKWNIQRGDLWQCGKHRILCGDCTDKDSVNKLMGSALATVCFTDPPYGVQIGAKNRLLNSVLNPGRNSADIESDSLDADSLYKMLLQAFTVARSVMSDCCSVFVCSPQGGSLGLMMMMMMRDAELTVRHVLNWVKNSPTFSVGRLDYDYQHEPILFTWTKTHKRIKGGQFHSSIWNVDKPRASKEHPTMKPVELPTNAILNHSELDDIVYEPFLGSGTTLVACEQTGRIGRGIEIEPKYVAVALERLSLLGLECKRVEPALTACNVESNGKRTRNAKTAK
jgi:DNA modification methylase